MKAMIVLATATLLGGTSGAAAQDADIAAGQAYAEEVCATCHAVLPNEETSPLPQAPTFQKVADLPGMTEMALTVWLQTSHPTMPNIVLKQDDLRNVVAYIGSLKKED
ncbi:c-type cytochrome [Methyloceanibacter sp.]|uniref:c-type cytochrome n=1 Tax=Methyloceanibacter sp. TaxID=1965321 RepID=UPI002D6D1197|nr:c-type cytochrome [Methyloceanibacter sp.]HZP07741.1 c-type cytochrome [Methyloceanibacter sp.]